MGTMAMALFCLQSNLSPLPKPSSTRRNLPYVTATSRRGALVSGSSLAASSLFNLVNLNSASPALAHQLLDEEDHLVLLFQVAFLSHPFSLLFIIFKLEINFEVFCFTSCTFNFGIWVRGFWIIRAHVVCFHFCTFSISNCFSIFHFII